VKDCFNKWVSSPSSIRRFESCVIASSEGEGKESDVTADKKMDETDQKVDETVDSDIRELDGDYLKFRSSHPLSPNHKISFGINVPPVY